MKHEFKMAVELPTTSGDVRALLVAVAVNLRMKIQKDLKGLKVAVGEGYPPQIRDMTDAAAQIEALVERLRTNNKAHWAPPPEKHRA